MKTGREDERIHVKTEKEKYLERQSMKEIKKERKRKRKNGNKKNQKCHLFMIFSRISIIMDQ